MFSPLCFKAFPLSIYMKQELKFVAPVFFNEDVEAKIEVANIDEVKKRITLKTTVLKIAENKPAIVGEALILWHSLNAPTK
jgi:3-hydroxybutyryl-CoA dehydratase